ncbi:MAG: VanZ family protein [Anaerolineales bacterium]
MAIYFDILGWFAGLVLLAGMLVLLWRRGRSLSELLFFSIFWIYLLVVIKLTLFPIYIDAFRREVLGRQFMASVNLIPFYFGPFTNWTYALPGLILNTLLTMPAGFGISFVTRFKPKDLGWLLLAFGFGLEGMQLLISLLLGYPYRTIDINDVIFNSLGVLLGYLAFRLFAWFYATLSGRFKLRQAGLFSYIHEVSERAV